jgi:hypothetical protein
MEDGFEVVGSFRSKVRFRKKNQQFQTKFRLKMSSEKTFLIDKNHFEEKKQIFYDVSLTDNQRPSTNGCLGGNVIKLFYSSPTNKLECLCFLSTFMER